MLTMERVGSSRLRRMRSARSPRSQYSIDEYCVYDGYEQPPAGKQKGKRHPAPLTKTHSLGIQPSLSSCSRSPTSPTYLSTSPTYLGDDLLLSPVGNLSPRSPTPSDNTSDADGMSDSPRERRRDRHHLCPDSGSNTNRYSVNDEQFDKMPSGGGFVRRAASFTYSPKGRLDKNNQRPAQLQEKEQTKKGFL
ncbi:hypothetical protein WR25_00738 [Diploscapter pachys]|uniref:Uncharacterized protein n=1 Tax=Diploscapter pachys TaxID=2018661 RepID=A0A2A2LEN6_9BILA|nr:hypothetical protein WR25_00738 [Diploscapter pachys]